MKIIWWILMVLSMTVLSCGDDNSCMTGDVAIMSLEDLGCPNTIYQMSVNTDKEFELIRNQADFDDHINTDCVVDIDWESYDLIAGMRGLANGFSAQDKSLVLDCMTNRLVLRITFQLNATTVAPYVSYHALIPKIRADQIIFVEIIENS